MALLHIRQELRSKADSQRALANKRFFKTELGEYGYGDIFIGVTLPEIRKLALRAYKTISLSQAQRLLSSPIHEERLLAIHLFIHLFTTQRFPQEQIFELLIHHIAFVNNWDLVDTLAPKIIGAYLWRREKKILYDFAQSDSLWKRRIAVLSTLYFIRQKDSTDICQLATMLLRDKHDLIHKAVGWMLREMGKHVSTKELLSFLEKNAHLMPRTMLAYATEKLDKATIHRLRQL